LDEWQRYLESQFVDDPDESEHPVQAETATSTATTSNSLVHHADDLQTQSDNWIPAASLFGGTPFLLSASVSANSPAAVISGTSTDGIDKPSHQANIRTLRRKRTSGRSQVPLTSTENPQSSEVDSAQTRFGDAVPKHVRLLIELGHSSRRKNREVAQSSYKRPFQESRDELIARLLDPILSLEEAARLLNVCPTTVRRYTKQGALNCYRKPPDRASLPDESADAQLRETRQRRFRLSDILAFLEAQEHAEVED
jgi:hypothetical protein